MNLWLAVALGGAFGAVNRYAVIHLSHMILGKDFPYGTLLVNVLGSFLIGLMLLLAVDKTQWSPVFSALIVTGFLGAFTTFSAFSMETFSLIQRAQIGLALMNIAFNVSLCLLAVYLGTLAAKIFQS